MTNVLTNISIKYLKYLIIATVLAGLSSGNAVTLKQPGNGAKARLCGYVLPRLPLLKHPFKTEDAHLEGCRLWI